MDSEQDLAAELKARRYEADRVYDRGKAALELRPTKKSEAVSHLKPLLIGALGTALFLGGWHLYVDHQIWHQLLNDIAANQQRQQQGQRLPAPDSPAATQTVPQK